MGASPSSVTSIRMRPLPYVSSTRTGPSPWVIAFVTSSLVTSSSAAGRAFGTQPRHVASTHLRASATLPGCLDRNVRIAVSPIGRLSWGYTGSTHRVGGLYRAVEVTGRSWLPTIFPKHEGHSPPVQDLHQFGVAARFADDVSHPLDGGADHRRRDDRRRLGHGAPPKIGRGDARCKGYRVVANPSGVR